MSNKELSAGEPVAFALFRDREVDWDDEECFSSEDMGAFDQEQETKALYSQDYVKELQKSIIDQQGYVNQLLGKIEGLIAQIADMQEEQSYCTFKDNGLSEIDTLCIRLLTPFPPGDAELNKTVAMLRNLESQNEALKKQLNKTDALIDQAYSNGAAAGFNCDTHEELAKIRESRSGYLAELKRVKS